MDMFGLGRRKKRKQADFETDLSPHIDSLYGAALRLTRNPRDAEDLVQETALRAFRFYHKYQKGTRFRAWLFKIQMNIFINQYRQRARESKIMSSLDVDAMPDRVPSTEWMQSWSDPEKALDSRGLGTEVQRALERLPLDFRMVVLLADLNEFTYREISEILECPIGTVMSRLHRGRKMLQRSLYHYALRQGILPESSGDSATPTSFDEYRRRRQARSS